MNTTSLVILIVIVAIVVIAILAAVAMMGRRTRLRALPDDAKARYASSWAAIQARFIEDPKAAVREADQLAVSMLRDRGAQMEDEGKLPADLKEARAAIGANADQGQAPRTDAGAGEHGRPDGQAAIGEAGSKAPGRDVA
jgi:hypothetical protein